MYYIMSNSASHQPCRLTTFDGVARVASNNDSIDRWNKWELNSRIPFTNQEDGISSSIFKWCVFTFSKKKKDGPMKTKMVSAHRRRHFQPRPLHFFSFGRDSLLIALVTHNTVLLFWRRQTDEKTFFFSFQVVCQWRRFKLRLWARQKKYGTPEK